MIFGIFVLFVAVAISFVSAFYSIWGLTAIFAGAFWPIVIMGSALEVGKIAAALWLHKHWKQATWSYKLYLIPAVCVLMLITSMGIFGGLSKAHLDQSVPSGDIQAQVSIFDEKIKTQRDNIDSDRKALTQLDSAVDQIMARSNDENGATKSAALRRSQQKERASLQNEITAAQKAIVKLQEERAPIASQARKVDAEVGPIKYVAALMYGDNPDQNLLERAVRWVIILIVFVFDPLAIILILAGTKQIEWSQAAKKESTVVVAPALQGEPSVAPAPTVDIDAVNSAASLASIVPDDTDQLKADAQELAADKARLEEALKLLHDQSDDLTTLAEHVRLKEQERIELENDLKDLRDEFDQVRSAQVASNNEYELELDNLAQQLKKSQEDLAAMADAYESEKVRANGLAVELAQNIGVTFPHQTNADNKIDFPKADHYQPRTDFGSAFPDSPRRGDMYLRVDFKPSRLFKWNSDKWIQIDKNMTDSYSFNDQYLQFLADKLSTQEYTMDDLSASEQQQVKTILGRK